MNRRGALAGLGLTGVVLYLALVLCPTPPHHRATELDPCWWLGLSMAHAQGLTFGEEIIFPYGPLAYLCQPDPVSGAMTLGLCWQIGLYVLYCGALLLLAWRVRGRVLALFCVVMIGAVGLVDPLAFWLAHLDGAIMATAILVFATDARRRLPGLSLLAVLGAAALLVKLNIGVKGVGLCGVLAVVTWLEERARGVRRGRRLLLMPLLVFLAALAALFAAAPGRLAALPAYLDYSLEMLSGYAAMSVDAPTSRLAPIFAGLLLAFVALPLLAANRRSLALGLLVAAVPAFLAYKSAVVRQDTAHLVPFLPQLALCLSFPLLSATRARDRWLIAALQVILLVHGGRLVVDGVPEHRTNMIKRLGLGQLTQTAHAIRFWDASVRLLDIQGQELVASLEVGSDVLRQVGAGTVDVVPWQIARVQANGLTWRPCPVMQCYTAYTARLDRLNAAHIESPSAADFVFADLNAIDDRHAFLEAPATWRALLDRYRVLESLPDVLLLRRREEPSFASPVRLASQSVGFGEEIEVPVADDLVIGAFRIEHSAAGRAVSLAYRTGPVYLEAAFRDGRRKWWRTVRSNLENGVISNYLPTRLGDLEQLAVSDRPDCAAVATLRFETAHRWQYRPNIEVEWSRLPLTNAAREAGQIARWEAAAREPLWKPAHGDPLVAAGDPAHSRFYAGARSRGGVARLIFELPAPATRSLRVRARVVEAECIRFGFGALREPTWVEVAPVEPDRWNDLYVPVPNAGEQNPAVSLALTIEVGRGAVQIASILGSTAFLDGSTTIGFEGGVEYFGAGCRAGVSTPVLRVSGAVRPGGSLDVEVTEARPGAETRLLIGVRKVDWMVQSCPLYIDPGACLMIAGVAGADGRLSLPIPVPDMPRAAGLGLTLQVAVRNRDGEFPAWSFSRGVRLTFGG